MKYLAVAVEMDDGRGIAMTTAVAAAEPEAVPIHEERVIESARGRSSDR